ncbi:MAG: Ig-like domain-containing protein, partial [Pelobacteraceae bacterium]
LAGPTILKITQVLETALPPVPEEGKYLAAFNIDTGAIPFQKEVHLSIPVPNGFDPDTPVFVAKPREQVNADGTIEKVYEIIDSTKIVNGRITTASPPFDGIWGFGIFSFISFPSSSYQNQMTSYRAVVSGTTYRDMDGDNTYSSGDLPVSGALVRAPGSGFVAYSKTNGSYATTVSMVSDTSVLCKKFQATATHPLTMYSKTMPSTVCQSPYNIKQLNFKLADKDSTIPDKTPPLININLQVAPGQPPEAKFTAGTVPAGTDILIPLTIIDQEMGTVTLTIQSPGAEFPQPVQLNQEGYGIQTPMSGDKPAILRYAYTPLLTDPIKGSTTAYFRPGQTGVYTVVVEAKDIAGNKSRTQKQIRAVNPGTTPGGIDGAPTVDKITPATGAEDVAINTTITVYFSEPVDNVTDTTFTLIDTVTGLSVPSTVTSNIENGRMKVDLTPKGNLTYSRKYQVNLTQGITDSTPNPSAGNTLLPLKNPLTATFTTKVPKAYDLLPGEQFAGGRDISLYSNADDESVYTHVSAMDMGWKTADVTDPSSPSITYTQSPINQDNFRYTAVEPQQKILGITESLLNSKYGYVRFYDLANPQTPKKVGQEKLAAEYSGVPSRLAISGKYAYVATVMIGLQVVDIDIAKENVTTGRMSTGAAIVGVLDTQGDNNNQPWDIALYGTGRGLLTTSKGYLLTLDLSTPQAPQIMNSFHPTGYAASRVAVAAEYAYTDTDNSNRTMDLAVTSSPTGKINTVDVSDLYNPSVIGTAKNESGTDALAYANKITINKAAGLAFIATFNSVQIIDIKDPYNPKLLNEIKQLSTEGGSMIPIGASYGIVEKDGWLYLADGKQGLKVIQLVTRPIDILRINPIEIDDTGHSMNDAVITYRVNSKDLEILSGEVNIYKNGIRILNLPSGTGHTASVTIPKGQAFDVNSKYEAEVVINKMSADVLTSYKARIPVFNVKPVITTVNDVTIDLDGYTLSDIKVNYTINPQSYQATNANVILLENGIEIKSASVPTTGSGSAVFAKGMKLDINKKYEVSVLINYNLPNMKESERKEVKVNFIASCKVKDGGLLVNLPNGARSTDGGSCCYQGDLQKYFPIIDLGKCPNRVQNYSWETEYDGCTNVPNNPAVGNGSPFSNADRTGACDEHDRCYQKCSQSLDEGRLACDEQFLQNALKICEKLSDGPIKNDCVNWANVYHDGLRALGANPYKNRQLQVCSCCN